jgi:hypothetical protein
VRKTNDGAALERFRRRLSEGPKKTDWTRWIGSPTAWIALTLSLATTFYSYIYYSDDLSVVVELPDVVSAADNKSFTIELPAGVTFINSGSRPIAITGMGFFALQPFESNKRELKCRQNGEWRHFGISVDPVVVRPYDLVTRAIAFTNKNPESKGIVRLSSENLSRAPAGFVMFMCIEFSMIVSGYGSVSKMVEIGRVTMPDTSSLLTSPAGESGITPIPLVKRNVFWETVGTE